MTRVIPSSRTCLTRLGALLLALLAPGCVSAPRETLELSEIVDRQIAAMQASHEKFVRLYYGRLRADVETFMEEKWIPQFLSNVVEGTGQSSRQFRADLDRGYKLAATDWDRVIQLEGVQDPDVKSALKEAVEWLARRKQATLGMVMIDFTNAAQEQINRRRRTLIEPIDQQEAEVLDALRASYADLQRGSTATKAYLASVAKLVEQRDAVLEKVGALDAQRRLVAAAARTSEEAAAALRTAREADEGVSAFLRRLGRGGDDDARPMTPRPTTRPGGQ